MSTSERTGRLFALSAALLLSVMGALPATAQTFEEAVTAYRRGDYSTAYQGFRIHAEQGDAVAQFNLGVLYAKGKGVPQDHAEAVRWYRRAADQGNASAQFYLGVRYAKGEGIPQDHAEAARWYRRAADQGHTSAQFNLGVMYGKGEGVPQDHTEAVRWYRRAAEQDHASAQFNLGVRYDNGRGVPQDHTEAARWYRRAAEQGHAVAQFNLGVRYDNGHGVPQDHTEAARWYRRAAEQGHADAQNNLGVRYGKGEGVPQDHTEAVRWYRRAAAQGHALAQFNLGVRYDNGHGVPQDYAEAARWYRRAAEQGDADAQFSLGVMYTDGEGVPQDHTEAVRWYRRAADQGRADAQFNLGLMYEDGAGVSKDFVQAHKWYNLAASRALSSDPELREEAVSFRDRIAGRLTPAQLAKAQRLARVWQPRRSTAEPPVYKQRPSTSAAPAPRASSAGAVSTRDRIANLQRALRRLGYDPGPSDGILGDRTRAAIRAFQADAGLPITGQISEGLESAVLAAVVARQAPAPSLELTRPRLERESTGSGFRVSGQGHVLTNAHVVRGCTEVRIPPSGTVEVLAREGSSDLALLRALAETTPAVSKFRQGRGIRPGASVVVVGYPLRGLLASEANVSTGAVSALAGPGDDRRLIQITAPLQPGNSGGPVLDAAGNVVGVVVAKLDAIRIARSTGDIPQNVNFAISAGATRAFLDAEGVPYETAPSDDAMEPVEVAAAARKFTVLVECWK